MLDIRWSAPYSIREGYTTTDLDRSAQEFLILNGIHDPHATVDTCSTDATLCTNPQRKLVRVVARATAPLAFLPVIGIDSAPIGAMAVSETASVDVVLVFDRSESMTYDAAVGNSMRDPSVCNASSASPQGYVGDCEPFNTVKDAAISFVNYIAHSIIRLCLDLLMFEHVQYSQFELICLNFFAQA